MERHLCLGSSALLLFGLAACGDAGSGSSRPNLLLVTLDTTRADRLGCYGYQAADTPALDALAARGVVFDDAHTPAPMTLPAHSTLMTGLLPPEHGARINGVHRLAEGVPTLAERLRAEGYRTGAFVAAFVLDEKFGLARGFDRYDDDLSGAYEQEVAEALSSYRPGNLVVDSALAWLGEEGASGPFFAWVHLYDAHFPWHPHGPDASGDESGTYDGELAFVDRQVGRLVEFLRAHGLDEDTLVIAVADHGEGLGDHHEIEHAYLLNEEVLRVPWIMAGPGIEPGLRVPALVTLADFQPTALELLGLEGTVATGRSLASAARGEELSPGVSYAETDLPWSAFRWAPQRSLTTERWKYIQTPQAELYDRATDRGEHANLAEVRADVRETLDARLRTLEASLTVRESALAAVTSDELDHLAALGYSAGSATEVPEELAGLADMKQRFAVKDLATELRRGLALETIGPAQHLELARRLVRESPETPAFHSQLGQAFVKLGDYERALPELLIAVELDPTSAGAHYDLGDAYQQSGEQAKARRHLELALELEPELAAAHVGMGNVLRAEGKPDLAAGEYTEALRLRPEYAEACFNLGLTFLDRNMPGRAIENLELALEHKPGWGIAHASLANLLMSLGRPEAAIEHFEGALAESPDDPDLRNDYGVALYQIGRNEDAREQYTEASGLQPQFFRPHINLGNLEFDGGDDAAALEHYEKALRLAPGLAEPAARLARFLATTPDEDLRDGPRAVELAKSASDIFGGENPRALDTLAAAYAAAGLFPMAVSTAYKARDRARIAGDDALAGAIEERIALYELEEPFVVTR
ncbi:MAG: tetratricopeptide repeat protein [Planctomycetota bacterium]|nr:MAG: tetratricopeptide repeat protein [Planctomycetota bacterium]